jgi:hypothetical protein
VGLDPDVWCADPGQYNRNRGPRRASLINPITLHMIRLYEYLGTTLDQCRAMPQFKGRKNQHKDPDPDADPTAGEKLPLWVYKNVKFPDQTPVPHTSILTLDELFEWIKQSKIPGARTVKFNIETKIFVGYPELAPLPEEFARLLIQALKQHAMLERTIIQSFDYRTLVVARRLEPEAQIALLNTGDFPDYVALAKALAISLSQEAVVSFETASE